MVLGSQAQRQFFSSIPIRKPCGASHRCRAGCVVAWHWLPRAVVGPERAHLRFSVLLRDTGCRAPWPGRKGARLRMPALLRDTGCRAHCRTERGSPSEGGTIARGEAPRTHATSPALELPILRRRVLGFSSWFRKGPYARVAEWQTRWLQVPVPFLGVEVQLLSRAHPVGVVNDDETPTKTLIECLCGRRTLTPHRCRCTL